MIVLGVLAKNYMFSACAGFLEFSFQAFTTFRSVHHTGRIRLWISRLAQITAQNPEFQNLG